MLDFDFYINTGNSPPLCSRQPVYDFHCNEIINKLIAALEDSDLIIDCEGDWGSLLLLAAKPHQESYTNIHELI